MSSGPWAPAAPPRRRTVAESRLPVAGRGSGPGSRRDPAGFLSWGGVRRARAGPRRAPCRVLARDRCRASAGSGRDLCLASAVPMPGASPSSRRVLARDLAGLPPDPAGTFAWLLPGPCPGPRQAPVGYWPRTLPGFRRAAHAWVPPGPRRGLARSALGRRRAPCRVLAGPPPGLAGPLPGFRRAHAWAPRRAPAGTSPGRQPGFRRDPAGTLVGLPPDPCLGSRRDLPGALGRFRRHPARDPRQAPTGPRRTLAGLRLPLPRRAHARTLTGPSPCSRRALARAPAAPRAPP
ncbi:hypothetical protein SUDANB108_02427 [Streptomyces sp. enrichment culture]